MAAKLLNNLEVAFFPYVWGCEEICPFCKEPCAKTTHDDDHLCKQHRPRCCVGIRNTKTKIAANEACNYSVQSDCRYRCGVINCVCKCRSITYHPYRDYRTMFKNWDILPSPNVYETASFWLRFIAKHREELVNRYHYILKVPPEWNDISIEDALKSLEKYN